MTRIHKVAAYLALVGLVLAAGQLHLAAQTARADLQAAYERLERDLESAAWLMRERLADHGIGWDGDWAALGEFSGPRYAELGEFDRRTLGHLRDRIAMQVQRTEEIAAQFPERVIAPALVPVSLPQGLTAAAGAAGENRETADRTHIDPLYGIFLGGAGICLSLVFSYYGFRRVRTKRLIEDLPTTPSAGVAHGQAELTGKAESVPDAEPLEGPLTGRHCVWFRYLEEERRGSGKNAHWVTLEDRSSDRRFLLRDREGVFPIDPEGAECIVRDRTRRRAGRIRRTEWLFAPGTEVYALGSAEIDPQTESTLVLRRGPADTPYILTDYSERALQLRKAHIGFLYLNGSLNAGNAVGLAAIGSLGALHGAGFLAAAVVPLGYTALFLAALMYNGLIRARLRVERGWANIQVSLKKRADLLPRLTQVLEGYLAHERELQRTLTELRTLARATDPDLEVAEQVVALEQSLLGRLGVLVEAHPDLKGDAVARELMHRVAVLENEVALMRAGYNDCVERYNIRRMHFPELLFTKLFGFRPARPFRAGDSVHAAPQLDLAPAAD